MKRTISGMMLILLLLGMLTLVFHVSLTQAGVTTRIYLDPSNYIFDSGNFTIGTCFNVTVLVENVANLAGFQVKMYFNDGIINVTRWFEPVWDTAYVFYGKTTLAMPSPPKVSYQHIGAGNGSAMVTAMLWPTTQPTFNGNGKLCILEFNITAMPGVGESLSCVLNIDNSYTYLFDPDMYEIPATKENGYYQLSWFGPPQPYITQPLNCSLIYGSEIEVSALEMNLAPNIVNTTFEYSQSKTGPWTLIAVDSTPLDGWRVSWNLTSLSEGNYYIKATMVNNISQAGSDLAHVCFDDTPPKPELTAPTFPTILSGLTNVTATTFDENVLVTKFWVWDLPYKDCTWYYKNVSRLDQHKIGAPNNGNTACGPTAAASCLAYWDNYTDPTTGQRPYDALYNETSEDKDNDGFRDDLEKMARELYDRCSTDRMDKQPPWGVPEHGTYPSDLADGINDYIRAKGLQGKLEAKAYPPGGSDMTTALKEFLRCQDVILQFRLPNGAVHFVTLSSVHFVHLERWEAGQKPILTLIDIDFMDPWDNKTYIGEVYLEPYNKVKADWNGNGVIESNEFADLLQIVTVCPKSPCWNLIDADFDGTDGWSIQWDTTQLPDAFYLVKATMIDATGNTEEDFMLVYINNARVTGITPNKTVVREDSFVDIQVSVENLYVESAYFNLTLYANETMIEMKNVTLASQTSTTLLFTWNTTSVPKGNYSITVKTSVLLNETHLARVTYVDGWILVTIVGDVNGDFKCDGKDIAITAKAFGSRPGDPLWDSNADINDDGKIDGKDIAIAAKNFGSHYP